MPTITFERWDKGLDLRKSASVTDGNALQIMTNCYVGPGWNIIKRPGIKFIEKLKPESFGLVPFNDELHTFSRYDLRYSKKSIINNHVTPYTSGVDPSNNPEPVIGPLPSNNVSRIAAINSALVFNNNIYVSVRYEDTGFTQHHYVLLNSNKAVENKNGPYGIVDANNPRTPYVVSVAGKIFSIKNDVVRYCAVNEPTDWSEKENAGFLPTGLKATGDNRPTALAVYESKLIVFHKDSIQIWAIDPDPQRCGLEKNIRDLGTRFPKSVVNVGDDVFFLSDNGVRSISKQTVSNNFTDNDVGTQIDTIIKQKLKAAFNVKAVYNRSAAQYWLYIDGQIYVYTDSKENKISAWSRYNTSPARIDDIAVLNNEVYFRSGDDLYKFDDDLYTDNGAEILVEAKTGFLSFKQPGELKQIISGDFVSDGSFSLDIFYDATRPDEVSDSIFIGGDTRPAPRIPIELVATECAFRIRHLKDEDFRFHSMSFTYNVLGKI